MKVPVESIHQISYESSELQSLHMSRFTIEAGFEAVSSRGTGSNHTKLDCELVFCIVGDVTAPVPKFGK